MKKHFLHGNHINTLKWLLFALFVLMNIGGSVAQVGKVSITGVVVDELGEPMVGVNVVVKGTTNGTVTDLDGKYSVSVSTNEKAIFVYSFIGYKSQEILVGNQRQINVKLMPDQEMLDEVVVIYYLYENVVYYIINRFTFLSNILVFLPVKTVFSTLLPVAAVLGIGIGFLGSYTTLRKHLKV